MTASRAGQWTTLQKVTPVIAGLGILVLVGLLWYFQRAYRRRKYSRRAQDSYPNNSLSHRRNLSSQSYSSTSHLNAPNPSQLQLPVHRIRFFFKGMLPVRERHRNPDWNIEGESGRSRRSSAAYDPPLRPESGSSFTSVPNVHIQGDTPPTSPEITWSPFRTMARWWTSVSPTRNGDYHAVHLLSPRKTSNFGIDDEDHPEPRFEPASPQNQASTSRNNRTSGDGIPAVPAVSSSEGDTVSRPRTPQPETEPPSAQLLRPPSLRPNRPGHIVAVEDPLPSQLSPSADALTSATIAPGLAVFPPPSGIREQTSSDTFHTSRTTLSTDDESEQTVRPKILSPQLLFPSSVTGAGYSVPQRPEDPVVKAWIPRLGGTSNRPAKTPSTEPPSYDQANRSGPSLPRPLSPTSIHPFPYTNHLRSTSDITALDGSRNHRRHPRDLGAIDTQSETALSHLSLAVNEPTSAPSTSGSGSVDGDTDFLPPSIVQGSESPKILQYTPYPSSAMLPLSVAGTPQIDPPPSGKK